MARKIMSICAPLFTSTWAGIQMRNMSDVCIPITRFTPTGADGGEVGLDNVDEDGEDAAAVPHHGLGREEEPVRQDLQPQLHRHPQHEQVLRYLHQRPFPSSTCPALPCPAADAYP